MHFAYCLDRLFKKPFASELQCKTACCPPSFYCNVPKSNAEYDMKNIYISELLSRLSFGYWLFWLINSRSLSIMNHLKCKLAMDTNSGKSVLAACCLSFQLSPSVQDRSRQVFAHRSIYLVRPSSFCIPNISSLSCTCYIFTKNCPPSLSKWHCVRSTVWLLIGNVPLFQRLLLTVLLNRVQLLDTKRQRKQWRIHFYWMTKIMQVVNLRQ